jgi:hypothetical protein
MRRTYDSTRAQAEQIVAAELQTVLEREVAKRA